MKPRRLITLRHRLLVHASWALAALTVPAADNSAGATRAAAPAGTVLREVLFSPGNITERKNTYDRFEPLRKPAQNPVMVAQMPWEKGGVNWGSVLRSPVDGKFKFFYCTDQS